ncbi:unnamed protein product [Prunus armeniaca]|uniref:Uncharacterized protein n=1 Tax=Prunus armeniaca TaxID=36596 RepID=A0A6J5UCU5_PRUAR|nr:unnamed protein product [Prunus armeniaca]
MTLIIGLKRNKKKKGIVTHGAACATPGSSSSTNPFYALGNTLIVTNALLSQVPERHQGSIWPLGCLMKYCSMLRNRMLADPSFLFKVGTEIVIYSYCATFAEVQKRVKDFWAEFELYVADLLVGIAIDIALVGMLAPYARIWKAISITRIIWKLTTISFHLHNRGILLLLVFFTAGAGNTMLISDAGKIYAFGKDSRWF